MKYEKKNVIEILNAVGIDTRGNNRVDLLDKNGSLINTIYFDGNFLVSSQNFEINEQIRTLRAQIKELQHKLK